MEFRTQKNLLEYLGKNPDDRHLVERMIKRWEVHVEGGMYIYEPQVKVKDLYNEIAQLKDKISLLENNVYTFNDGGDYNEAKAQRDYYQDLYEKEVKEKQEIIRRCFRRIQKANPRANREEFRDWVLSNEE